MPLNSDFVQHPQVRRGHPKRKIPRSTTPAGVRPPEFRSSQPGPHPRRSKTSFRAQRSPARPGSRDPAPRPHYCRFREERKPREPPGWGLESAAGPAKPRPAVPAKLRPARRPRPAVPAKPRPARRPRPAGPAKPRPARRPPPGTGPAGPALGLPPHAGPAPARAPAGLPRPIWAFGGPAAGGDAEPAAVRRGAALWRRGRSVGEPRGRRVLPSEQWESARAAPGPR